MTTAIVESVTRPPRHPARRLALSLALALVAAWIVYVLPATDAVLAPVNEPTARLTAAMLYAVGLPVLSEGTVISHAGGFASEIGSGCTALIPALLLAAAVLGWPASRRARFIGVVGGTAWMVVLNQVRLVSLVWIGVHDPGFFGIAHDGLWPVLLLLAGVVYWAGWAKAARR